MIEQPGLVTRVEGGFAWVRTERRSSCGSCSAGGCGTGALGRYFAARSLDLRSDNSLGAAVGEQVVIGVSEETLLRGSVLAYLLPLLGMMGGGALAQLAAPALGVPAGDGVAIAGGLVGLAAGFSWLFRKDRRIGDDPHYQARILRRSGTGISTVKFIHSD